MIPANNTWRRRPLGKGGSRDSWLHLEVLKRQICQLYLSSLTGIFLSTYTFQFAWKRQPYFFKKMLKSTVFSSVFFKKARQTLRIRCWRLSRRWPRPASLLPPPMGPAARSPRGDEKASPPCTNGLFLSPLRQYYVHSARRKKKEKQRRYKRKETF